MTEDRGGDRVKGFICTRDSEGQNGVEPFGHEEDTTEIRSAGSTLELVTRGAGEARTHVLRADPAKPKRLMYH